MRVLISRARRSDVDTCSSLSVPGYHHVTRPSREPLILPERMRQLAVWAHTGLLARCLRASSQQAGWSLHRAVPSLAPRRGAHWAEGHGALAGEVAHSAGVNQHGHLDGVVQTETTVTVAEIATTEESRVIDLGGQHTHAHTAEHVTDTEPTVPAVPASPNECSPVFDFDPT
jgi:hypothetical protein